MAPTSPVVARWDLGRRLKEKRDLLGLDGPEVRRLTGISPSYLSDVEGGKKSIPAARLDTLVGAYEFSRDEAEELHRLRVQAGERGWWSKYTALFTPEILRMFGYEHGAEAVLSFNNSVIIGLLQTRDYAQAMIESGSPNTRLAECGRRVEARMIRQRRLTGDDPVRLTAVLSEAALRQRIGGPDVLLAQLRHLADLIDAHPDTLDVLIVPFGAGGHPAIGGSFHLFTFPTSALPSLAWQETVTSTEIIEDAVKVREYGLAHAGAVKAALSKSESLDLINEVATELN
ncbi:MAG TPA: helix-turn-helix transcriptional regulator [Pseudonocardiaceae bacterium]|jgi:transcriptional regulator with XRE-family HTH domain|nr:helix-turn-helix transcriptional regulator [Pseudonocardiaceae bacterium]